MQRFTLRFSTPLGLVKLVAVDIDLWLRFPILAAGAPYLGLAIDTDGNHVQIMENPSGRCESCHRTPHLD